MGRHPILFHTPETASKGKGHTGRGTAAFRGGTDLLRKTVRKQERPVSGLPLTGPSDRSDLKIALALLLQVLRENGLGLVGGGFGAASGCFSLQSGCFGCLGTGRRRTAQWTGPYPMQPWHSSWHFLMSAWLQAQPTTENAKATTNRAANNLFITLSSLGKLRYTTESLKTYPDIRNLPNYRAKLASHPLSSFCKQTFGKTCLPLLSHEPRLFSDGKKRAKGTVELCQNQEHFYPPHARDEASHGITDIYIPP